MAKIGRRGNETTQNNVLKEKGGTNGPRCAKMWLVGPIAA